VLRDALIQAANFLGESIMTSPSVLLLELNELCPSLLDQYMAEGRIPHFRRLYETSTIYTTDAGEREPNLEPWIQWPTVHTGLPYSEHGVFRLGDGHKLRAKGVAQLLSEAGIPVGVFGSMNLNYGTLNGYVMPDPWNSKGSASPSSLQPFHAALAHMVQESSQSGGVSRWQLFSLGWFLLWNGLTVPTALGLTRQLLAEVRDRGVQWRRGMVLDRIQYDVFRRLNRRHGVRFATLFCNSTAHFQHYHWRNLEPEEFEAPPPESDHPSLHSAIPDGYCNMDRIVGRVLRDYPAATVILCTALSQQAWKDTTKCTFRPVQFHSFLEFARIPPQAARVSPVMAEQFHLECDSHETATVAESRIRELAVDDQPLMIVRRDGNNLFTGCRFTDVSVLDRKITRRGDGSSRPFTDLFHMIHTMRSGRHHPDGALWIRGGRHRRVAAKVPLTDVAPTILSLFGIAPPSHMKGHPLPI
jgi:hypothetical protein